ncbi:hypothetical protein [Actinoplanes xinjiangensis]|uniref:hypothetical protein n=1 Tax=Actinoplanes xinjiangensis TaxID=512350 RepID=UPI003417F060
MLLAPSGLSDLDDLIADRRRTLDIVSFLLTKLAEEQDETGEAISARDISRDGRRSELCPGVDEIVAAIDVVRTSQVDVLRVVEASDDPRFTTHVLGAPTAGARWLRALADAIERPAGDA